MKVAKVDVRTKKVEEFDNGLPEPEPTTIPESELVEINLAEVKKIIEYAKKQKWI